MGKKIPLWDLARLRHGTYKDCWKDKEDGWWRVKFMPDCKTFAEMLKAFMRMGYVTLTIKTEKSPIIMMGRMPGVQEGEPGSSNQNMILMYDEDGACPFLDKELKHEVASMMKTQEEFVKKIEYQQRSIEALKRREQKTEKEIVQDVSDKAQALNITRPKTEEEERRRRLGGPRFNSPEDDY